MAGCWLSLVRRLLHKGGWDGPAAAAPTAAATAARASAWPSSFVRTKNGALSTADESAGGPSVAPSSPPAIAVNAGGIAEVHAASLAASAAAGERSSSPNAVPSPGCTVAGHTRRSAAAVGDARTGDGTASVGSAADGTTLRLASWGENQHREKGGDGVEGRTGGSDAGRPSAGAAPGQGYPLIHFQVWPCSSSTRAVSRTRKVAPGGDVHVCLGRNLYVLWKTRRCGVPESVDAFRKANPTCIRLERGVGTLRAASKDEATAAGLSPSNRLLFVQGTELSSAPGGGALPDVKLLLMAPSAEVCAEWAAAEASLLFPWETIFAAGCSGEGNGTRARELLRSVMRPLPATADAQPNAVSQVLPCRVRRWALNANYWLMPTAPATQAVGSVVRKGPDVLDAATGVPVAGLALWLGLLGVQVGALSVLAEDHDARCRDAVKRCEVVASDVLGRIVQELAEDPTEIRDAYVKLLFSLMEPIEGVLEDVERTFFMAPGKATLTDAAVVHEWEQLLKEIDQKQVSSRVDGAHGHSINSLQKKLSGMRRDLAARSIEPDLSKYHVGWMSPALGVDYVAGVDKPGRAEHSIVRMLERYAKGGGDQAPRVGVCAMGGSGKSTACAGVAASKRVRDMFPSGAVWVQLNSSSSMQTVADAAMTLAFRFCREDTAKDLLRQMKRNDFVEVAAGCVQGSDQADAAKWLVVIDDVPDIKKALLFQLLRIVPRATPVIFTTRAEAVVAAVAGAELIIMYSLPDADARVILARAVGKRSDDGQPDFSEDEEAALVRPVLEQTMCHALSLSIVAALIADRSGRWRRVVAELKTQWMDASFARPTWELDPQPSVRSTLDASLALLPDDACRAAFGTIGILPANELISVHVLERLWRSLDTGGGPAGRPGFSHRKFLGVGDGSVVPDVERVVDALARAGLLHQEVAKGVLMGVVVHPVGCGYALSLLGDNCRAVHQRLLDDYAGGALTDGVDEHGWRDYEFWTTPDDGYWNNNVARHAAAAGNICALVSLTRPQWCHARVRTGSPLAYRADLERVRLALRAVERDAGHEVRATPVLLGMLYRGLAQTYADRSVCNRAEDLGEAITLFQRGLELVPRVKAPLHWARLQADLGQAYADLLGGDSGANAEAAVACYRAALEVFTRGATPLQWATTQNNLGNAYKHRVSGDRGANLEAAVACYRATLEVITREALPLQWAVTQNNLGIAYNTLVGGDRGANVEAAMVCLRAALEVYTQETAPLDWAMVQHNLGTTYENRVGGNRGANVEAAVACYRAALEVYTREAAPQDWADTTWNILKALQDGEQWAEALASARALLSFGSEWERWHMKRTSLATRTGHLEGKVAATG